MAGTAAPLDQLGPNQIYVNQVAAQALNAHTGESDDQRDLPAWQASRIYPAEALCYK